MSFPKIVTEDIRLVILRALEGDAGYSHNESILHTILEQFGHKIGRDRVRTEMCWLRDQGLLTVEEVMGGCLVATLSGRGTDVATGRVVVPGVKRPRPGA